MLNQFKQFVKDNQNDIILIIGIILIALISFGAGRLYEASLAEEAGILTNSPPNHEPEQMANVASNTPAQNPTDSTSQNLIDKTSNALKIQIVGNKNSKIYHYPWCSGAKNMKEGNKVFFNSIEEAQKAGYKPAGNCPGL